MSPGHYPQHLKKEKEKGMNLKKSMKEGDRCEGAEEDLRRPSKLVVFLALAVILTTVANGAVSQSAHAATLAYGGSAYGTYAFVGTTVVLGKTAPVGLSCGSSVGANKTSTVLSVTGAPLVTTGTIDTEVSNTTNSSEATATVEDVTLLGGVITATEVQAVSSTSQESKGLHVSGASSRFLAVLWRPTRPFPWRGWARSY
jgi:hypothetical protein